MSQNIIECHNKIVVKCHKILSAKITKILWLPNVIKVVIGTDIISVK